MLRARTFAFLSLLLPLHTLTAQCLPQFRTGTQQGFPGANAVVQSLLTADPDGAGPVPSSLIVGGNFTVVGNVRSTSVAYYNVSTGWVRMGREGGSGENIYSLAAFNGSVLAGGGFGSLNPSAAPQQPRNVARWTGTTWERLSTVPNELNATPQSLIDFNGTLYAVIRNPSSGFYAPLYRYNPGPTPDTGTWTPLATFFNGSINGAVVFNSELYLIGSLTRPPSGVAFQVAKLNPAGTDLIELPVLGSGGATARGAVVFNGSLYVYGSFSAGPNNTSPRIVRLNPAGNGWSASTNDPTRTTIESLSEVSAAAVLGNVLTVGISNGSGTPLANLSATGVWTYPPTAAATNQSINAISPMPDGQRLAIGSNSTFTAYGNTSATRLAFWDRATNTWSTPAAGLGDNGFGYPLVYGADAWDGDLYLIGGLSGVGSQSGNTLAKWNGSTLAPVPGIPSSSFDRAITDPNGSVIYFSGDSAPAHAYNGTTFTLLSDSTSGGYTTGFFGAKGFARFGGDLVIAGNFSRPGPIPSYLARRSGTTWAQFGAVSPNAAVTAMTSWSSPSIAAGAPLLVISGSFTSVGPLAARVAAWDGTTWRALGQPAFATGYSANPATALLVYQGDLYMCVYANGINASNNYPILIRYNPVSDTWSEVPRPPANVASGFSVPNDAVVLADSIWVSCTSSTAPGTGDSTAVLRWNGSVWSSTGGLAGGFPQSYGLAVYQNDIILHGPFAVVGTQPNGSGVGTGGVFSNGWARLSTGGTLPSVTIQPIPAAICGGASVSFSAQGVGQPPLSYRWQRVDGNGNPTDLADGPIPGIAASALNTGTPTLTLTGVLTAADRTRFRCVVSNDCGGVASTPARLFVDIADIGTQGGVPGRDGLFNNNDFIVFIDRFFAGNPLSDIGRQGGVLGDDGLFNNNDFIVFIDRFFAGCV